MSFITDLLDNINNQVNQYTFEGYHMIVSNFSVTLSLLLILYFVTLGWLVLRGIIPLTPMALAWHIVKAAIIFALALNWDYFSLFFVDLFVNGADRLTGVLLSTQMQPSDAGTLTNLLSDAWSVGNNVFADLWRSAGDDSMLAVIMGLIGYLSINGMTAVALFFIIMSKIALSVLLVLAPVFLPMYLWGPTRAIFNGWLQLLIQWMLTPVLLYIFLGLFMPLIDDQITSLASSPLAPTTASISIFALLSVVVMAIFKQAGTMSRHLSKKVAINSEISPVETVPAMMLKAIKS